MISQLSNFFIMGNMYFMSILTILLASLFLAAWKAPAWVLKIGILALVAGILFGVFGFYQMIDYLQTAEGDVSQSVIYGGYKCMLIPTVYGFIIFIVAQLINIFQSPRI